MKPQIKILVTGDHEKLRADRPSTTWDGRTIEWIELPVLDFVRLPVETSVVEDVIARPADWVVFTSPRAVRFFSELLLEQGADLPAETKVAVIGEATGEAAAHDGYNPDFFPSEPGSEKFLEEFEEIVQESHAAPKVLLPAAEGGRTLIAERLTEMGCPVVRLPLYKSVPRNDLDKRFTADQLSSVAAILFTSPSSVEAFTKFFPIPENVPVIAIGSFTGEHLAKKGLKNSRLLPEGDFHRIGEVLC